MNILLCLFFSPRIPIWFIFIFISLLTFAIISSYFFGYIIIIIIAAFKPLSPNSKILVALGIGLHRLQFLMKMGHISLLSSF